MDRSDLEAAFAFQLRAYKLTGWTTEYLAIPGRKFRMDFAFPAYKVAVELEGGVWMGGRHNSGTGFTRDCEKHSLAACEGWLMVRATADQVNSGQAIEWVKRALEMRSKELHPAGSAR